MLLGERYLLLLYPWYAVTHLRWQAFQCPQTTVVVRGEFNQFRVSRMALMGTFKENYYQEQQKTNKQTNPAKT